MGELVNCHNEPARGDGDWWFHPLWVTRAGSGRVVVCAFAAYTETPAELLAATGGQFTPRAIRWLAGRPLDPPNAATAPSRAIPTTAGVDDEGGEP
jgi:hypothetical protein